MVSYSRLRDDGTRERVQVPKGIDPGWASNPGKSRSETLMQSLTGKLEQAGPDTARAALGDFWKGSTPAVVAKLPARVFAPVAITPAAVKTSLGALADVVMISADTMATKLAKHAKGSRPLTPEDFGRVQHLLDKGHQVQFAGSAAAYILEMDDGWWKAAVKTAQGGHELIVRTLFPIRPETAESLLRRKGDRAEDR
jgi:hypothetical protein